VTQQQQHILFVNVQGHGHVYPSLGLVSELTRRGHRVTYVTTPLFTDDVATTGARVVHYRSVFDDVHVPELAAAQDAEALLHLYYLRENVAILRAAEAALAGDVPDLVVYDVFPFIAGRLLATRWGVPAVRLSAIFAANEHYSIFEALWRSNGQRHPADVEAFQPEMKALLAEYGVEPDIRAFWNAIEDLNIVFIPRSFQIAAETFDDRFVFVGPNLDRPRQPSWEPPADGGPVLLVSLGNQFNEHPEFFRACAEAFAGTPWHVVLAIGSFLDPADLGELPPNATAYRWVPFLSVLRHASVCITQGTTGAVMDALHRGCPLIVVPHFAPEAVPSADRVVELGLGIKLAPQDLEPAAIRRAAEALVADPAVRERVRAAGAEIASAGGAARGADAVEAHLRRSGRSQAGSLT
jgi:dTDP-L-oleandrosyltransferase